MSSSVKKIGYPFMESKICETGWCHLQSGDQMPDYGTKCAKIETKISELHTD